MVRELSWNNHQPLLRYVICIKMMYSQIGKLSTQGGEFTSETGWDQGWTPEASRMTLEQKMMPESWLQKTFLFHRLQ